MLPVADRFCPICNIWHKTTAYSICKAIMDKPKTLYRGLQNYWPTDTNFRHLVQYVCICKMVSIAHCIFSFFSTANA